jgi:hypothetical protein
VTQIDQLLQRQNDRRIAGDVIENGQSHAVAVLGERLLNGHCKIGGARDWKGDVQDDIDNALGGYAMMVTERMRTM